MKIIIKKVQGRIHHWEKGNWITGKCGGNYREP